MAEKMAEKLQARRNAPKEQVGWYIDVLRH